MSVRSGQVITTEFTTRRFDTGAATVADSTPTGTLYVNGTADAATVTVTSQTGGKYKAQVTLPTLSLSDVVSIVISATVNSVSDNAKIWEDTKDIFAGAIPDVAYASAGGLGDMKNINGVSTSPVTTVKPVQGLAVDGVITTLTNLPAAPADWLTDTAFATSAVNELRNAITGYAGSLNLDSGGNVKVSDGTGANQIDTVSGAIAHVVLVDTTTLNTDMLTASGVWAAGTRVLTAGTNIALAKGTGVTGFNDLDATGVRAAVGLGTANLDTQLDALPTNAELATALAGADDAVLAAVGALNNITAASVWAVGTRTLTALGFTLAAGDFGTDWLTSTGLATSAVQEIRNAVTGGAYALDTDANGRMRIVDGTGAGEIDTISGAIAHVILTDTTTTASNMLTAAQLRAALGMAAADLDSQFDALEAILGIPDDTISDDIAAVLAAVQAIDVGGGSGNRAITFTINDGTNPLQGALVIAKVNDAEVASGYTNVLGHVVLDLNDGTNKIVPILNGYTMTPDNLVVSDTLPAGHVKTYSMTALNITPSVLGRVTGILYCDDLEGVVTPGVTVYLRPDRQTNAGVGFDEDERSVVSAADGLVEFPNLVKTGIYVIREEDGDEIKFQIPATATTPFMLPSVKG